MPSQRSNLLDWGSSFYFKLERFWLFLQILLKNFFDSTTLSSSLVTKNSNFWSSSRSGLLINPSLVTWYFHLVSVAWKVETEDHPSFWGMFLDNLILIGAISATFESWNHFKRGVHWHETKRLTFKNVYFKKGKSINSIFN